MSSKVVISLALTHYLPLTRSVPLCLPLSLYQPAVIISMCVAVGTVSVILATVCFVK